MTLIPLMSALAAASERAPASANARYGYDPGARHRPIAAAIAIGLPAALVVAVALSPMIVDQAPRTTPLIGTLIELPKPPQPDPEPRPEVRPQPRTDAATETVEKVFKLPFDDTNRVADGPVILDPPPLPPGPEIGIERPAPPKLATAQVDPRYAGQFQPDYPLRQQRAGVEGSVVVRVLIGTDGRVKAVELVRADDPAFFEATKKRALAKWRFKPATRGGVAEESWREMTVSFVIRDA